MNTHRLIHPDKKIAIAVSGGVDSMVLADILASFNQHIELIHFNHGTRPVANLAEEKMVLSFGKKHGVKVNVFHFDLSLNEKNFEKKARILRREIFDRFLKNNYWIYTAHHIDDSFEWTLMQSFKQTHVKSTLGIPVFNRGIVRPFMCVTKKQIFRYARAKKIQWLEDLSNQNTKFERNFLRLNFTGKLLSRYPAALKHYVSRHNQMAHTFLLHRLSSESDLSVLQEESGGVVLISSKLHQHKNEVKDWIHHFSSVERGEIDKEVDKLLLSQQELMKNAASFPFKGPMNFSGKVTAYLVRDHLFIGSKDQQNFYREFDQNLKHTLENMTQIPELALSALFPFLVINGSKNLHKSSKFIHPLLPVTCQWLKHNDISYAFAPLLGTKDRQILEQGAVILDSSVLGL